MSVTSSVSTDFILLWKSDALLLLKKLPNLDFSPNRPRRIRLLIPNKSVEMCLYKRPAGTSTITACVWPMLSSTSALRQMNSSTDSLSGITFYLLLFPRRTNSLLTDFWITVNCMISRKWPRIYSKAQSQLQNDIR